MLNTVLSRNLRQLGAPLTSHCILYSSRNASSINTAIHRGLRKSAGVGFRGKQRDFGKDKRGSQQKEIEWGRSPISRDEGRRGKPDLRGSGKGAHVRIRRGDKIVKTDAQLARKKPNPAGSSRSRGSYTPNRSPVDLFENEAKASLVRRSNAPSGPPAFRTFDAAPRTPGAFGNTTSEKIQYPSLSFGKPSSSQQRETLNEYSNKRSQSYRTRRNDEASRQDPRSAGRSGQSRPANEYGFKEELSAPLKSNNKSGSRGNSVQLNGSQEDYFRSKGRDREDSDRRSDEDAPRSTPQSPKPDTRLPLSIPYTTPASEFLYGTSVVEAALSSHRFPRRQFYKLYVYAGEHREKHKYNKDVAIEMLARKHRVEIVPVTNDGLRLMDKMSSGRPHNGYILEASPLPRLPVTSLGELVSNDIGIVGFNAVVDHQSREEAAVNGTSGFIRIGRGRKRRPLVLLLDGIVDPQNLGGILRTASFLGVSAVAISTGNSARFTPVVLKASTGASENITLFSVNKPDQFIQDSKGAGWKVFAAVAPSSAIGRQRSPELLSTDNLIDPLAEHPCILMLGGEGEGLRQNLRTKANFEIYIPMSGRSQTVDSLNVNVAAGVLCSAFLGRRKPEKAPSEDQEDPQETANKLF